MSPTTWCQWLDVARERAGDAETLNKHRAASIGSVYLAGYAIECSLKAYLNRLGRPFPRSGRAGHDLQHLWRSSNLRLGDLDDRDGSKSFFIEQWSTDLRYLSELPAGLEPERLLKGAQQLTGWIQGRTRRLESRSSRRKGDRG